MPSQKYALIQGGPKRLEISWKIFSQKRTIKLDGKELGVIPNQKALKAGWELTSKNGTTLTIKNGRWGAAFDIRLNGQPLPNTDGDPQRRVNNAAGAIIYMAAANVVAGLAASGSTSSFMDITPQAAPIYIGLGLLYAFLAFAVWRGSLLALILALGIYGLDTVLIVSSGLEGLLSLGVGGAIIRLLILTLLITAIKPIRTVKAEKARNVTPRTPLTRVELSLLLVVILLVGVLAIALVASNIKLRHAVVNEIYSIANLPTLTSIPLPTQTPRPTRTPAPTGTPQPVETLTPLPFKANFSAYSNALDRIIAVSEEPNALHIYDPETGENRTIDLGFLPTVLTLSPSHRFAAVGHDHKISYIDLEAQKVVKVLDVEFEVQKLALPDNGWVYAYGLKFFNPKDYTVEYALDFIDINADRHISRDIFDTDPEFHVVSWIVSPDGQRLYVASYSHIYRYDLNQTPYPLTPSVQADGTGDLSFSADGNYMFTTCSKIFKMSQKLEEDLYDIGQLGGCDPYRTLVQSLGPNWIIEFKLEENKNMLLWRYDPPLGRLLVTDAQRFWPPKMNAHPDWSYSGWYEFVNVLTNAKGTRYYMIMKVTDNRAVMLPAEYNLLSRDVPPIE